MTKEMAVLASAMAFMAGGAIANDDVLTACETTLGAEGENTGVCSCVAEKASEDEELAADLLKLDGIEGHEERLAAASDKAVEAIESCSA